MTTSTRQLDYTTGVETSELPTSGSPTNPTDTVTLDYADKNYQQGTSMRANIAAVKAIVAADRKDGDVVFVKDINEEYYFDSGSVAAGDDDLVLAPDAGTGRWLKRTILNKANTFTDTTQSTTTSTGSNIFDGGVAIKKNLNVGENVVITGNLTVNGTETIANTATLDVTDANITVNDGGDQATANTNKAGITVEMSDATDAVMGYDSSLTSKWKCGETGSESEVLTAANAQTVTAVKKFDVETEHEHISTPGTNPAAGSVKAYFKSDNALYVKTSSGVESKLGEAVTSADKDRLNFFNYITNHNFEVDNTGWSVYDDGASATPVDGTGDAGNLQLTLSSETGSPIKGTKSLRCDKAAANGQGNGIAYDFSIDTIDQVQDLRLEFMYRTSGLWTTGDVEVFIYKVNGTTGLLDMDEFELGPAGSEQVVGITIPQASIGTTTNFRLLFHWAGTTAVAQSLFIDQVVVGNGLASGHRAGLVPQDRYLTKTDATTYIATTNGFLTFTLVEGRTYIVDISCRGGRSASDGSWFVRALHDGVTRCITGLLTGGSVPNPGPDEQYLFTASNPFVAANTTLSIDFVVLGGGGTKFINDIKVNLYEKNSLVSSSDLS